MHRHKEPSRVLYYPLVWLQMIGIYWTKRVLCYYYVLTYWQRGWWNCCRSSEAASVKYSCFSNFRNPKIGFSPIWGRIMCNWLKSIGDWKSIGNFFDKNSEIFLQFTLLVVNHVNWVKSIAINESQLELQLFLKSQCC